MVQCKDEEFDPKVICKIHIKSSPKAIRHTTFHIFNPFSASMKRPTRPVFSFLLLVAAAAIFGYRVAVRSGLGSIYVDGEVGIQIWGSGSEEFSEPNSPLDFPLFNSTLLKLAEIEVDESKQKQEIDQLLQGNFGSPIKLRRFATWQRLFNTPGNRLRPLPASLRSPETRRIMSDFKRTLSDWSNNKRFQPNIMDELVDLIKTPIDKHHGLFTPTKKYSSCAVVGNSGILLTKDFGELIDSHEAVIRLNNARIEPYQKNVGSKTTISFVNSNILHLCARRENCYCHPYGTNVPIVMYMCQPAQFLDYVVCKSSHKSPLIVTDPRFDILCSRVVKYYSLKRFGVGENKTLGQWNVAHDGAMFHYSSGMQAVMLAVGVCDKVSLFGFGKLASAKHHYHTNQKAELGLHDYEAEYEFYRDLIQTPRVIPFFSREFKFPPVLIHR